MGSTVAAVLNVFVFISGAINFLLPWNQSTLESVYNNNNTSISPTCFFLTSWVAIFAPILFIIFQALPKNRNAPEVEAVGNWFSITYVLQVTWVILWCYGFFLIGTLILFVSFFALAKLNNRIRWTSRCFRFCFSFWLGWITMITFVSADVTIKQNMNIFDSYYWAIAVIAVSGTAATMWLKKNTETGFPVAINWALFGISLKPEGDTGIALISFAVACALMIMIGITLVRMYLDKRKQKHEQMMSVKLSQVEMNFNFGPPSYFHTIQNIQMNSDGYFILPVQYGILPPSSTPPPLSI